MVDAISGAIYVIGGIDVTGTTGYNDVWASTDGGACAGLRRGGALGGYYGGTQGALRALKGTHGILRGYSGVLQGVLRGCYRGY